MWKVVLLMCGDGLPVKDKCGWWGVNAVWVVGCKCSVGGGVEMQCGWWGGDAVWVVG